MILIIGLLIAGLIKPKLLVRNLGKYANRRHIAIIGVSSVVALGSIIGLTEPDSVKQARLEKENTSKQSLQALPAATPVQNTQAAQPKIETREIQEKQAIPFTKEQRNDSSLASGRSNVVQAGINGEKTIVYEVTYTDGKETARTIKNQSVTTQPVNEVTTIGTYVYVAPPAPVTTSQTQTSNGARTGAICNDGTRSDATGRGACSHHKGVDYWLY